MLVMRKVAQVIFNGTSAEFNKFWPLPDKYKGAPVGRLFSSDEEYRDWYKNIREKYKFK